MIACDVIVPRVPSRNNSVRQLMARLLLDATDSPLDSDGRPHCCSRLSCYNSEIHRHVYQREIARPPALEVDRCAETELARIGTVNSTDFRSLYAGANVSRVQGTNIDTDMDGLPCCKLQARVYPL